MTHLLYSGLEELLSPAALSRVTGETVETLERHPLSAGFAHSGSGLEFVQCRGPGGGSGPRLVLKRVSREWDWLMRVTGDTRCRSVSLWSLGFFDRLPPWCEPPVLACCRDGSGWALLMRDYSGTVMTNRPFTGEANRLFLDTAAAMHARFLDDPSLAGNEPGLCALKEVYGMFSPATAREEIARGHDGEIPARILEGWGMARDLLPSDVMDVVEPLVCDSGPLCRALQAFPFTLIHGDYRHSNFALTPGPDTPRGVVLLDWQLAAHAPPAVELGRYLGANSPLLPESKDEALSYYRERFFSELKGRARSGHGRSWWDAQEDLALLGGFVQDGWAIILKATHWHVGSRDREHWKTDLAWWADRVRRGAERLR
ncbi:Phosphotransferase enzyme family protein [Alkalispirochaeta americana]|uniref:Phosphotransferase enzyme family protein n=1 Tax=Alkalispirochaeta americana TaxID=159291 RepID=A0A1N6VEZ9_9SPIO|nr:phosphotransferase [Alkalispirochaeta americana]SIQ76432.1 Phosphotransferase enzyme family protein [Alkalispirochaeta americana]